MSDEKERTQPAPLRYEHPSFDAHGSCTRCGCDRRTGYCPPGFWMTKEEHARWDALMHLPDDRRWKAQAFLEAQLVKGVQS